MIMQELKLAEEQLRADLKVAQVAYEEAIKAARQRFNKILEEIENRETSHLLGKTLMG